MHSAIEKSFQYRKVLLEQITYPLGQREEREGGGEGGVGGGGNVGEWKGMFVKIMKSMNYTREGGGGR